MKNDVADVYTRVVVFTFILFVCPLAIASVDSEQDEAVEQTEGMDWISKLVDDLSNSLTANGPINPESENDSPAENSNANLDHSGVESVIDENRRNQEDAAAGQNSSSSNSPTENFPGASDNSTELNGGGTNTSATNLTDATENSTSARGRPTKVTCLKRNNTVDEELPAVQVLNSSTLPVSFQTVPNRTVAPCTLALFYAPWCHFSAAASPHYNALPRIFPDVSCVAINSAAYSSLNARFGTVAIPTLLLLHNGQPVAKFNETQYTLENFAEFVKKYTGLEPFGAVNVTSADFEGPLPSVPAQDADYLLWTAWIFLISYCCYAITRSTIWHRMMETLRNNWQEAEAQHEHGD